MVQDKQSVATRIGLALVRGYQRFISPRTPPCCRFSPTCSEYMFQAMSRYGALRGIWLGIKRIARCHPWSAGGYDPVPETLPDKHAPAQPGVNG